MPAAQQQGMRCPRCRSSTVLFGIPRHEDPAIMCMHCGFTDETGDFGLWDRLPGNAFEDIDRSWTWPTEHSITSRTARQLHRTADGMVRKRSRSWDWQSELQLPVNQRLFDAIVASPDDDRPRYDYARWLRTVDHPIAAEAANWIEVQLVMMDALRVDPRRDLHVLAAEIPKPSYEEETRYFEDPTDRASWWRFGHRRVREVLCDFTWPHVTEGLISSPFWVCGFVEHVAIQAERFLEIAEELYSLAPIRHLTLTYCKGKNHDDVGLWQRLLDSPHLEQIRSLRIWGNIENGTRQTVLNRLDDSDLAKLARSSRLRRLAYLELRDQRMLTGDGFNVLASSSNLPALSCVEHRYYTWSKDDHWYDRLRGEPAEDRLLELRASLEARHGWIPWLHAAERYGDEHPEIERVVAHPFESHET